MTTAIDSRSFRNALGQFATGVTIVTTIDHTGRQIGLTANSFNAASLDPPMVLWSLSRRSANLRVFSTCDYFSVNVLAEDQKALSERFASKHENRFLEVDWEVGIGGIPLLRGCAARFQCRNAYAYEGGDHVIFVGEVVDFDRYDRTALVFHKGNYAVTLPLPEESVSTDAATKGGFSDDFLFALLRRAFAHISRAFQAQITVAGLTQAEWRVLATLSDRSLTVGELAEILVMKSSELASVVDRLCNVGMVRIARREAGIDAELNCTAQGTAHIIELLAAAKAYESDALVGFSQEERQTLKGFLRRLIQQQMR